MLLMCSICTELVEEGVQVVTTRCGHIYHHSCLVRWFEEGAALQTRNCPQCREPVLEDQLVRVYPSGAGSGLQQPSVLKKKNKLLQNLLTLSEQEVSIYKDRVDVLQAQLNSLRTLEQENENLTETWKRNVEVSTSEITEARQTIEHLKQQLEESKNQQMLAITQYNNVNTQLLETQRDLSTAKRNLKEADTNIRILEVGLDATKNFMKTMNYSYRNAKQRLQQELKTTKENLAIAQRTIAEYEEKIENGVPWRWYKSDRKYYPSQSHYGELKETVVSNANQILMDDILNSLEAVTNRTAEPIATNSVVRDEDSRNTSVIESLTSEAITFETETVLTSIETSETTNEESKYKRSENQTTTLEVRPPNVDIKDSDELEIANASVEAANEPKVDHTTPNIMMDTETALIMSTETTITPKETLTPSSQLQPNTLKTEVKNDDAVTFTTAEARQHVLETDTSFGVPDNQDAATIPDSLISKQIVQAGPTTGPTTSEFVIADLKSKTTKNAPDTKSAEVLTSSEPILPKQKPILEQNDNIIVQSTSNKINTTSIVNKTEVNALNTLPDTTYEEIGENEAVENESKIVTSICEEPITVRNKQEKIQNSLTPKSRSNQHLIDDIALMPESKTIENTSETKPTLRSAEEVPTILEDISFRKAPSTPKPRPRSVQLRNNQTVIENSSLIELNSGLKTPIKPRPRTVYVEDQNFTNKIKPQGSSVNNMQNTAGQISSSPKPRPRSIRETRDNQPSSTIDVTRKADPTETEATSVLQSSEVPEDNNSKK